jgi:flagellar assembly protein FliH
MSTIIRSTDHGCASQGAAFNLNDLAVQAEQYLSEVRAQGAAILEKAKKEAAAVRRQAEVEGREAAMRHVDVAVGKQMEPVLPALHQAITEIVEAKQAWLMRWEAGAIRLATAIAQRVIRREIEQQPAITLELVREALELAAGNSQVCIRLNPSDHKTLGGQVRKLAKEVSPLGEIDVKADPEITPGGCRVDTSFGAIDQQIESQLKRIEEELLQ